MSIIAEGKIVQFLWFVVMVAIVLLVTNRARKGKKPVLRRIPAVDALDELMGRAAETGRPALFTPGGIGIEIHPLAAVDALAGMMYMSAMANKAAGLGVNLIGVCNSATNAVVMEDMMKEAYISAGHPEIQPDVRPFLGGSTVYMSGLLETIYDDNVAVNVDIGVAGSDLYHFSDAGYEVNSMQVVGSPGTIGNNVFGFVYSDYFMFGEEPYAAAALLTEEPSLLGQIVAEDVTKAVAVILIIIGAVLASIGIPIISEILSI